MEPPIINRSVLRAGDWICRRGTSVFPAHLIMRLTASTDWTIPPDAWNHDAILIDDNGHPAIGDALMGRNCQLTTPFEWEQDCRKNGTRILILRPAGASVEDGEAAAQWWLENVWGRDYDKAAIVQLALKRIFKDLLPFCGKATHFYCSEGNGNAWRNGPSRPFNITGIERDTPGASYRAWKLGRLVEAENSLTEEGKKYRIGA